MKTRTLVILGVKDTLLYNLTLALILVDQKYPDVFTTVTVIVGLAFMISLFRLMYRVKTGTCDQGLF